MLLNLDSKREAQRLPGARSSEKLWQCQILKLMGVW